MERYFRLLNIKLLMSLILLMVNNLTVSFTCNSHAEEVIKVQS